MLQLTIGYARYQCLCVHYVTHINTELIVGLSVGFGVLLVILVTIVSIAIQRCIRRSKPDPSTEQNNNDTGLYSRQLYDDDHSYDYIPSSIRLNPRTPSALDLLQTEHENSWPTPSLNRNTAISDSSYA